MLLSLFYYLSKRPTSVYDSDEMEECTDAYRDYVIEQVDLAKRIKVSHIT